MTRAIAASLVLILMLKCAALAQDAGGTAQDLTDALGVSRSVALILWE